MNCAPGNSLAATTHSDLQSCHPAVPVMATNEAAVYRTAPGCSGRLPRRARAGVGQEIPRPPARPARRDGRPPGRPGTPGDRLWTPRQGLPLRRLLPGQWRSLRGLPQPHRAVVEDPLLLGAARPLLRDLGRGGCCDGARHRLLERAPPSLHLGPSQQEPTSPPTRHRTRPQYGIDLVDEPLGCTHVLRHL
jgi:hypothetical protein